MASSGSSSAASVVPEPIRSRFNEVNGLTDQALVLQEEGQFAAARPLLERAMASSSCALIEADELIARAFELQKRGELSKALACFQRALDVCDTNGMLFQVQGEYAKAWPLWERALAICGDFAGRRS